MDINICIFLCILYGDNIYATWFISRSPCSKRVGALFSSLIPCNSTLTRKWEKSHIAPPYLNQVRIDFYVLRLFRIS